jgi:hypothetical protein
MGMLKHPSRSVVCQNLYREIEGFFAKLKRFGYEMEWIVPENRSSHKPIVPP